MSLMIAELYDALTEAGASEETARKASQAVADSEQRLANIESELKTMKWVLAILVASHLALFAKIW